MTARSCGEKPLTEGEILIRLRTAVVELDSLDAESGGAIDLSAAIETLRRAITELEEAH
jgi:hypothetical protein